MGLGLSGKRKIKVFKRAVLDPLCILWSSFFLFVWRMVVEKELNWENRRINGQRMHYKWRIAIGTSHLGIC